MYDNRGWSFPESITTLPIKTSGVSTVSEFFDHWDSYTSVSSSSINLDVEVLGIPLGGKFSTEYGNIKTKQISEKSSTTRMQVSQVLQIYSKKYLFYCFNICFRITFSSLI
jgi:hypothetical protein